LKHYVPAAAFLRGQAGAREYKHFFEAADGAGADRRGLTF
jgi:hypothetical protein